jgi:hypothetical protein
MKLVAQREQVQLKQNQYVHSFLIFGISFWAGEQLICFSFPTSSEICPKSVHFLDGQVLNLIGFL